ncbi:hypothetical protein FHS26_005084 [Rhizobium pisi]|uniref:Uncharacterized protein n=1 Tax=Rhizobium pisi TaxID=574561 RepID=A0A3R9ABS0_9HYPH|nr:hypothetical protein [Rhizobium pisi]MBB3137323.1 hypothetical protein [Rhizobium pisi]RSB66548.1 hypothetical protein EFD55_24360 [Rhizobium pisi]TCA56806.1 hypothetical protein E0J16_14570 [Rhizobium pisi]
MGHWRTSRLVGSDGSFIIASGKHCQPAGHDAFGFRINRSQALAMLWPVYAGEGTTLDIKIFGTTYKATLRV